MGHFRLIINDYMKLPRAGDKIKRNRGQSALYEVMEILFNKKFG